MVPSLALTVPPKPKNFEEVAMQQTLIFSDSLKDLKNLRTQLYSAAEYFELSDDDQKRQVMESLKDYGVKALVNTVDHLGSVTYKVNDLLDKKIDQASVTELRLSCLEQRLQTCQKYAKSSGLSDQSLEINAPKYHKRYILPVGETMLTANNSKRFRGHFLDDDDDWHHLRNAVRATILESPAPALRKEQTPSPSLSPSPLLSLRPLQRAQTFMFPGGTPNRELDKQTTSPHRFPLLRFGTFSSRPTTPNSRATSPNSISRPTTPNLSLEKRRYASEPRKTVLEKENKKELEHYPSKSKRLFKALLSRRKSKKDEVLYTYLDEY